MADGFIEAFNAGASATTQGTAVGLDWAKQRAAAEIQRTTLEQKQQELNQQKEQRDYETGKWFMDEVQKIAAKPASKYKNELIKNFQSGLKTMGYPQNDALSTLLVDETYANEVNQAIALYHEMPPDMRAQWLPKMIDFIGSGDPAAMLKEFNSQGFEIRKMNEQGKINSAQEKLKSELGKEQKGKEQTLATQKDLAATEEYKEYSAMSTFFDTLRSASEKPSKFRDLSAMFAFMKALDPNSVVRESEGKLFITTGSAYEGIAQSLQKMWNGESLTPEKRKELFGIGAEKLEQYKNRYQTRAADTVEAAVQAGANRNLVDPGAKLIKKHETLLNAYRAKEKKDKEDLDAAVANKTKANAPGYDAETVDIIKKLKAKGKSKQAIESMLGRPIPGDLVKVLEL